MVTRSVPGGPAEGQLVTATVAGGGTATYRVTNIRHPDTGIWTWDLVPVAKEDD